MRHASCVFLNRRTIEPPNRQTVKPSNHQTVKKEKEQPPALPFYEDGDEKEVMIEALMSFKRAGADLILTYFAKYLAEILGE